MQIDDEEIARIPGFLTTGGYLLPDFDAAKYVTVDIQCDVLNVQTVSTSVLRERGWNYVLPVGVV